MVIYLIGLMGSGKSTLGAALASELGYGFYDTDKLIEQRNKLTVADIFAQKGEDYFRSEETAVINGLAGQNCVVSCGGGLPFFNNLMDVLLEKGTVIYLHALPVTLAGRIHPSDRTRPLLPELPAERTAAIERLYNQRNAVYARAPLQVEIDGRSISGLIAEIRLLIA